MTEEAEKHPGGRPSGYDPSLCARVVELGADGKSKAQIARALGVVRQTLENWAAVHPEFLDALKDARDAALAWWEDQGQAGLTADKFNATAYIFQVKNRFPRDYRDRQEHTGANGGPVQTLALDPERLRNMTTDELTALESAIGKLQRSTDGDSGRAAPAAGEGAYSDALDSGESELAT